MPVSPKQCIENFTESDKILLKKIETTLDTKLLTAYHGQGRITITVYETINERIRKILVQHYTEAGWISMEFKQQHSNDPREPYTATEITLTHMPQANYLIR